MALETKLNLSDDTLQTLAELVQVNLDSRDGFRHAAEGVQEVAIANMFVQLAEDRDRQAQELQMLMQANGQPADQDGSFAAAAHRTWIDVKQAMGGGLQAVLDEAERGEDHIKAQYEDALQNNVANAASDVLHRHYAAVKAAHDRVRDMRDAHREGA